MAVRHFSVPALCSLLIVGLAACADDKPPPATGPNLSLTDDANRLSGNRSADIQTGGLAGFTAAGDRVFFAYDSFTLEPDARRVLERQAQWLKTSTTQSSTVKGHSDEPGTGEYNLAPGDRSAT